MAKLDLNKQKEFFTRDIWTLKPENFPRWQRWFITSARVIILAVRGYGKKDLDLRATALTLYSLLSVVPVIAMIFGIAQGFGLESYLTEELQQAFANQPEVLENLLTYSHNMLSNTRGGLIAGIGLVLLIWSVVQVLGNIESAFNSIWYVHTPRTWSRKFTDYLAIMLLAPVFIILSGSINIFISTSIHMLVNRIAFLGETVQNIIVISLNFLPYLTTSILFFLIYLVMPNIRVRLRSALIAGIVAGCFFQLFQWAYITFQVGVSRYNAVYGSFASIPLFITWLQLSWIIVLIGAEISYCVQNLRYVGDEKNIFQISHKMRMLYSLYILNLVAKRFKQMQKAPRTGEISEELGIPLNLCRHLLENMVRCGLIAETVDGKEHGFVPALDIAYLDIRFVIDKLESLGEARHTAEVQESFNHIEARYEEMEAAMQASSANRNITDF